MAGKIIKIFSFIKGIILVMRPHIFLGWLIRPLLKISNTLSLSRWVSLQPDSCIMNDFYSFKRNYSKRYQLYKVVSDTYDLKDEAIIFIEFGVAGGHSMRWWLGECINKESRFIGFDTFEGLPEKWGTFKKGDMAADIPDFKDHRTELIRGLFQHTVNDYFLSGNIDHEKRKIIHMDADLFSSTLYALACISGYLKKGDILFFDEFNVPDHEFYAFRIFSESWYFKTKLLGAVNNYLQTAFIVE